jgi:hypothetical protein
MSLFSLILKVFINIRQVGRITMMGVSSTEIVTSQAGTLWRRLRRNEQLSTITQRPAALANVAA